MPPTRRLYLVTRDLHLYVGLFLSPFILAFACSVFYLVHGLASRPSPAITDAARVYENIEMPSDLARLDDATRAVALRSVLDHVGVRGEIDFVRHVASEHRLEVPVRLPTTDATVVVDYGQRRVTVATRRHPFREALVFLHKMPGPHNASVRGNSNFVRAWARLADASAYGLLFLTLSGVYLWTALKAERTIGILLIVAGALSFFGLVYGLVG